LYTNARGGYLDAVDRFDAAFFGYFPTEVERLDPQQRLLLEVTHEAMEDSGLRRDQFYGSHTAVYVGSFMYDYPAMQTAAEHRDQIDPYVAMGTTVSALVNRISYDFNLKGPSVSLDTACSSSLVAIHLACSSLWAREADLAVAGGVNVMLRPESSVILSKAGFLNPDQYCKAFDTAANGYVRGEGVGVCILNPLRKAVADGDAVYAVVRGSGVNQDGYLPEGFTVPNVVSQIGLLDAVYAGAGVAPSAVDYVEALATGTAVGDPIEALALGAVLGQGREPGRAAAGDGAAADGPRADVQARGRGGGRALPGGRRLVAARRDPQGRARHPHRRHDGGAAGDDGGADRAGASLRPLRRPPAGLGRALDRRVAAAFASGAVSLDDAVRIIYHRSQAQDRAARRGGMLAVGLSADECLRLVAPFDGRVSVAAANGPKMVALSGDPEPLHQIAQGLEGREVFNRPVLVRVAYHSHHMDDDVRGAMLKSLYGEAGHVATTPLFSTVTGHREDGIHLTAQYWYENARRPVLYTNTVAAMLAGGYDTFVEIGPHPVLVGGAKSLFQARDTDATIGPAMTHREPGPVVFQRSLARLAARGVEVDATALFGPNRRYVRLPKYPWQHARYWF
jgi:acyl transferase domain-containing protein